MIRFLTLLLFFTLTSSPSAQGETRVIKVAILNDTANPVSQTVIEDILHEVFTDYKQKVGIKFVVKARLAYKGVLTDWPLDQAFYLQRVCPQSSEIRVVFSNKKVMGRDEDTYLRDTGDNDEFTSQAGENFGYIIMFNVDERYYDHDAAGHRGAEIALKHDLAHLFGVKHSENIQSFMFHGVRNSFGKWTPDTTSVIRANLRKRWFPYLITDRKGRGAKLLEWVLQIKNR